MSDINHLISNVVFYNHWHNGDLFLPKAYIVRLIDIFRNHGISNFSYAHKNSHRLFLDLEIEHIPLLQKDIPVTEGNTIFIFEKTLYINTWVGVYRAFFRSTQEHSTLETITTIWSSIYYTLQMLLEIPIFTSFHEKFIPINGIPTTNWDKYEKELVEDFTLDKENMILFCNGPNKSLQTYYSGINLMKDTIQSLAEKHKNYNFICTHKFELEKSLSNIFFTDDILKPIKGGDINEIAYISTFCEIIIGKNSGPYMYCHVKDNILRKCLFLSISDRQSDDYLYNLFDVECDHIFFNGKEEKLESILNDVLNKTLQHPKKCVITNTEIIEIKKQLDVRNF